jgi:hypothetical protein
VLKDLASPGMQRNKKGTQVRSKSLLVQISRERAVAMNGTTGTHPFVDTKKLAKNFDRRKTIRETAYQSLG